MKDFESMTTEELVQAVRADYERFEAGCDEDTSSEILLVLEELQRRSEPQTPPPWEELVGVKAMADEALVAVWEAFLKAPIEEPASDFVVQVLHELVEREALE